MSSQSSNVSHEFLDDHDEVGSCATYSSGWERSSSSEYFEDTETDVEDEDSTDDDDMDASRLNRPFYVPYKKTGQPTLFDIDYKLELVTLPHPYTKNKPVQDNTATATTTLAPDSTTTATSSPAIEIAANPWKKINQDAADNTPPEDPWKFLEALNKPLSPKEPHKEKHRDHHRRNDRDRDNHSHNRDRDRERRNSRTTTSRPIDNSDTNKLCKYKNECRMNKNNNCSMVHALTAWKPRICRFNTSCKKKTSCSYYHTDMPLGEYLKIMMKTKDTIYAKNYAFYEKYLK